jgi:succinate dehydrogenase / fumarate reductase cytochrome b subunit
LANVRNTERPLSPHLTIWKWGPGMAVSIVHRVCGSGLATVGAILLVWWLVALSNGAEAYARFAGLFTKESGDLNFLGYLFGIGLTFVLFQHMASGVRHFFLDAGDNFELKANKASAYATFVFSVLATIAFWFVILEKLNG